MWLRYFIELNITWFNIEDLWRETWKGQAKLFKPRSVKLGVVWCGFYCNVITFSLKCYELEPRETVKFIWNIFSGFKSQATRLLKLDTVSRDQPLKSGPARLPGRSSVVGVDAVNFCSTYLSSQSSLRTVKTVGHLLWISMGIFGHFMLASLTRSLRKKQWLSAGAAAVQKYPHSTYLFCA